MEGKGEPGGRYGRVWEGWEIRMNVGEMFLGIRRHLRIPQQLDKNKSPFTIDEYKI